MMDKLETPPAADAELVERLLRKIKSGQYTIGGANIDATGKGKSWGCEPIMVYANPDGPAAAARIEALSRPAVTEAMVELLERCRDREYNPFEPDNQTKLHDDLVAMLAAKEAG